MGKQDAFLKDFLKESAIYFWQWRFFLAVARCVLCKLSSANSYFLPHFSGCNCWAAQQSRVTKSVAPTWNSQFIGHHWRGESDYCYTPHHRRRK